MKRLLFLCTFLLIALKGFSAPVPTESYFCFHTIGGTTSFVTNFTAAGPTTMPSATITIPGTGNITLSPIILSSTGSPTTSYSYTVEYDLPSGTTLDSSECYTIYFGSDDSHTYQLCECAVPSGGCYTYDSTCCLPYDVIDVTIVMTDAMAYKYTHSSTGPYLWIWNSDTKAFIGGPVLFNSTFPDPVNPGYTDFDFVYLDPLSGSPLPCLDAYFSASSSDPNVPAGGGEPEVVVKICPCCQSSTNNFSYFFSASNPSTLTFFPTSLATSSAEGWNFGDGGTGTGSIITHTYSSAGNYNVCMQNVATGGPNPTCSTCRNICVNTQGPLTPPYIGCNDFKIVVNGDNSIEVSPIPIGHSGETYSWDFGDGTSTSPTTSTAAITHTYASVGSYTVTLTVSYAGTVCYTYAYICTSLPNGMHHIAPPPKQLMLNSLYPNPTSSDIKLNLSAPSQESVDIKITDVDGRVVLEKQRKIFAGSQTISLPVSTLANGMYSIEITDASNTIRQKFVKY